MTFEPVIVAIDGPAGSGKSSVAKAAAQKLQYGMLDTGSAYRALTYTMLTNGYNLDSQTECLNCLAELKLNLPLEANGRIIAAGQDISAEIRSKEIAANVSRVSKHPEVRDALNKLFRQCVKTSGLAGVVIEGRDITTVVFPDASCRLILTADQTTRAKRRHKEMPQLSFEQVLTDLEQRDAKDLQVVNFIDPAPGVQLIDTTNLDFEGSVAAVVTAVTHAAKTRQ